MRLLSACADSVKVCGRCVVPANGTSGERHYGRRMRHSRVRRHTGHACLFRASRGFHQPCQRPSLRSALTECREQQPCKAKSPERCRIVFRPNTRFRRHRDICRRRSGDVDRCQLCRTDLCSGRRLLPDRPVTAYRIRPDRCEWRRRSNGPNPSRGCG